MLPAPTVAAAGTLAFQRLSSPRPSAVPCPSAPALAIGFPPVRFAVWRPPQAGSSVPAPPSVLRRPQFLTTWAWQSLVPLPPSARFRVSGCCWRVSFSGPSGTAPFGAALAGFAFGRIPQGEKGPFGASRRAVPRSAFAGAAPGLATIGLAASAVLRDAVPASGTGLSGVQSAVFSARLSTLKMVSMHTFQSGPIGSFLLLDQCLAALFRSSTSLSTRQMLRLVRESHKQLNAKLSTGSPMAGGQLCKLRNRL